MDIGRTEGVQGTGNVQGPRRIGGVPPASPASVPLDKVEISDVARLVSEIQALPQVRPDRIDTVRRLIESGRFETSERLEGAIGRFLQETEEGK